MINKIKTISKNGQVLFTKEEYDKWISNTTSLTEKKIKDGSILSHIK